MASVHDEDEFMLITQQGKILRTVARDIRTIGRATQGVRLIEIDADDRVVALARLAEQDDEPGSEDTAPA
jgi:DNA gyrase subunit A